MAEDEKIIWMKCRAKGDGMIPRAPCSGNSARVVRNENSMMGMKNPQGNDFVIATGGNFTVYECVSCKGRWTIRT